jgi:hypothetical protein
MIEAVSFIVVCAVVIGLCIRVNRQLEEHARKSRERK